MQQLLLDMAPTPSPTLKNFQPGRNVELVKLLQKVLAGQEQERFVYLWGGSGCGKSHLLEAVVQIYTKKGLKAVYFGSETNPGFIIDSKIDCVAVDNVDRLDAPAQIKLFNLYNQIRDEGHVFMLVGGYVAPAQLSLRQDLVTRFGSGLIYRVHELTDEEKMQAMKSHATGCGFKLSQDICDYLLRYGRRDLSSLLRTLDALDHYSLVNQRRITVPLLRQLLQAKP